MAFIKSLVSRDRNRFQEDGYNLDLTYITDRVLAMGIPATGVSTMWRNNLNDVCEFLEARHKGHFMIWNLTENTYDYDKFNNQIFDFPFSDHHAPPLNMLFTIVKSIDGWLQVDPENVAVVHCKGGKGRTGLVICCWLIYSTLCLHPDEAQTLFAEKRSSTGRGVKQPSQKRYIEYFYSLLVTDMPVVTRVMEMKRVLIGPFSEGTELILEVTMYEGTNKENKIFTGLSRCDETSPCGESMGILPEKSSGSSDRRMIVFNVNSRVSRDILITVKRKKKVFFHLNFNTMFTQAAKHTRQILPSEFDKYDAKTHGTNIVLAIEFDKVGEEPDDEMASMIETIKLDFIPRYVKEKARREKEAAATAAAEADTAKKEEEKGEKEEEEKEGDCEGEVGESKDVITLRVPSFTGSSGNEGGEGRPLPETPKKRRSGSFSAIFEKRKNQSKRRSLTLKKPDDGKSAGKEGSDKERGDKSDDDERVEKMKFSKSASPDPTEAKWVSSKPRAHHLRFRPLFSTSASSLPSSSPKLMSPGSSRRGKSTIYPENTKLSCENKMSVAIENENSDEIDNENNM